MEFGYNIRYYESVDTKTMPEDIKKNIPEQKNIGTNR